MIKSVLNILRLIIEHDVIVPILKKLIVPTKYQLEFISCSIIDLVELKKIIFVFT